MRVISLQSGSNGNCVYVEADGLAILIDAGISARRARQRLAEYGIDITQCAALLISHDHSDHVRHAGVYHRTFGLPVCMTEQTYDVASRRCRLGEIDSLSFFTAGDTIRIRRGRQSVTVRSIPTPHDGTDCVAFVVEHQGRSVGVFSDLGHVFDELREAVQSVDAMLIESNYDPQMLQSGSYPEDLKDRIRGPGGHLSNEESAELTRLAVQRNPRLRWAALCHLSRDNNTPERALHAHRRQIGDAVPVHVASRYESSGVWSV